MSFRNIRGQDKPIQLLKNYLQQNYLQGGYLFVGSEGVGKRLIAKTLAKALNCQEGQNDSCDRCASCLKIENNQHPDVYLIDASSPIEIIEEQGKSDTGGLDAIKIDHIRQLQKNISLRPYEGRRKVFIIDNCHKLTPAASNAFLKILEEPPKDSLIILVTDKPALLFKTIISRCKVLKFIPFKIRELEALLKKEFLLSNNVAHFLAYFSEGRIGYALRLKEKDIFGEKNRAIDNFALNRKASFEDINLQKREQVRSYLDILASWYRDIYMLKIGMPHAEIINFDRKNELLSSMGHLSFSDLNTILDSISDSIFYLEHNINVKLLLHNLKATLSVRG
jgi:DNA polymerase-3 subunit delta'